MKLRSTFWNETAARKALKEGDDEALGAMLIVFAHHAAYHFCREKNLVVDRLEAESLIIEKCLKAKRTYSPGKGGLFVYFSIVARNELMTLARKEASQSGRVSKLLDRLDTTCRQGQPVPRNLEWMI